ncbi:MAG: hypothetical protein C5B55_11410 [Blastocatellia bacterium]|nr:MAG: hypothetical protein C5B55_11410 [Blastocatellia bacterium]
MLIEARARSGSETAPERFLDHHLGNAVHLFLSLRAVLIIVAASIATLEIIIRDIPQLWRQGSEYDALHQIIHSLLLVAIAAELALLFLFHRTSAAIEVLIFIIARKMVTPGISGLELLAGVAALAGLIVIRYYFISTRDRGKQE